MDWSAHPAKNELCTGLSVFSPLKGACVVVHDIRLQGDRGAGRGVQSMKKSNLVVHVRKRLPVCLSVCVCAARARMCAYARMRSCVCVGGYVCVCVSVSF